MEDIALVAWLSTGVIFMWVSAVVHWLKNRDTFVSIATSLNIVMVLWSAVLGPVMIIQAVGEIVDYRKKVPYCGRCYSFRPEGTCWIHLERYIK